MGLQAATHWDGLGHASYGGKIYGGRDAGVITEWGATVCGIEQIRSLTGRGVLLDIARLKGLDVLEPAYAIGGDDLVRRRRGPGRRHSFGGRDPGPDGQDGVGQGRRPGRLHRPDRPRARNCHWPRESGCRVRSGSTSMRPRRSLPTPLPSRCSRGTRACAGAMIPMHCLHLVEMGLTQGQNFDLEALATDCAADGQWDFFLEASPQPFVGRARARRSTRWPSSRGPRTSRGPGPTRGARPGARLALRRAMTLVAWFDQGAVPGQSLEKVLAILSASPGFLEGSGA